MSQYTRWPVISGGGGGSVTDVTASSPLSSSGGATPNLTIQLATSLQDGYLSSVDWSTFNSKQAAGSYITALTGDGTAAGPGSAALTLATVNSNVGSFGSASSVNTITVNGKGLITAVVNNPIQITESQVTNLTSDLALLAPLDSPVFTGTPVAPTATIGDSSTQIATTAFVQSQGFLTSTGSIPASEVDNATAQTSATTTFVNALTTTVTLTQTAQISVSANATLTTTTSASVAGLRVTVNGVASRVALITLSATATNYLGAVQYVSAALAPGTYTVNFDFQRNSGTGTVNYVSGTLNAVGLQGANSNGITRLTGDVTAGPGSGSQAATIAAASVTGAKIASATITGANIAATTITNSNISTVDASKITTGTLPIGRGGTGATAFANQRVPFSNGTNLLSDALFIYDTTNNRLSVGGFGTATGNFIVASGSKTALQAFNQSAGNAFQATNVSAYTAALISRQNNGTTGASIGLEFGRGTPASPSGALNGDQIGVIAATPDSASGVAFGYAGSISFVASEDATSTATGGEIVLATTPNGTLAITERVRVKNSGETVFAAAIATARMTTAQKNALTPAGGWVVFDTDLNQLSYYNGTVWVNL